MSRQASCGWPVVRLRDVTTVGSGTGFPLRYQGSKEGKYPFYKVSDMNLPGNEVWMLSHNHSIDEPARLKLKATAHPAHTVIFPKIGAAIATNKKRILSREACFDNNVIGVHPSPKLATGFLFHLLASTDLSRFANTGNPPSIRKTTLEGWRFSLPSFGEQQRIAAILDAADALRVKRRASLEQLDTLLQSTFLEMFGDSSVNPMGWEERAFGSLAQSGFRNGLSPSTRGAIEGEVLTLSAITHGRFDYSQRRPARFERSPDPTQLVSSDVFLICRGNGNKQLVGVGVFPDRTSGSVSFPDTMIGVRPDPASLTAAYLQAAWGSTRVRDQIERSARTTNGTHKVNQQILSSLVLLLPPLDLQRKFATLVEAVENQKERQRAHLAELDTLFASLQQRAFRGDL